MLIAQKAGYKCMQQQFLLTANQPNLFEAWNQESCLSITPKGMLSQMLAALCDINQTHLYGNTCIRHNLPQGLCICDKDLLACRVKHSIIKIKEKVKQQVIHIVVMYLGDVQFPKKIRYIRCIYMEILINFYYGIKSINIQVG